MKKQILAGLFAVLVAVTGCQKDDLSEKVNDLDKRVSALEEKVKELNERTIPGIQATVAALQAKIYVTDVTVLKDGYEITFSDGTKATIANGKDGEKGERGAEPVISAQEIDGEFYWTVDGKPMLDAQGKKIPVHAALPQLRINEGKWEVSYDEGKTWKEVPTMGSGGAAISIEDTDTEIIFYINGQKYVVKKEVPFFMVFEKREMAVGKGETALVEYNISGILATDEVEVDVLSCTQGWEAKVMSVAKADVPGYIAVTNNEGISGKIFVYATNGKGKTDIKSLVFEDGQFITVIDAKTITAAGGDFSFKITTNIDYEVSVDPDQTWLTYEPETKAVHTDVITLKAQENTTSAFRTAEVYVTDPNSGSILEEFVVAQYPNEAVTTDLASLANVEDGTTVVVNGVKVVASAQKSAVIYDGEVTVYVKGQAMPVGKDVKIEGEKQSMDEYGTPMIIASKFETKAGSSSIADPEFNYIGVATNYSPARTMTAGVLSSKEGAQGKQYYFIAPMGQTINIETPDAGINLAALEGKMVEAEGYTTVVVWPESGEDAETADFILEGIKAITVQENPNWTLSYSYAAGEEYPEIIKNTVSGSDKGRYALTYYSVEEMKEYYGVESISDPAFPETVSIMFADDFQFNAYYLLPMYGFTTEEVFEELTAVGTSEQSFEELEYGKYIAIATGIDDIGGASGYYAAIEFEKKEPVSVATYADFLGKWDFNGTVIEISQNVEGQSYLLSGLPKQTETKAAVIAAFEDGKLVLDEHKTNGTYTHSSYGACDVYCAGAFNYSGQDYSAYPINTEEPTNIFKAFMMENGSILLKNGTCEYGPFSGFCLNWVIQSGASAGKGNNFGIVPLVSMKKYEEKKSIAEYEDFIGSWLMGSTLLEITQDVQNETYKVSGFPGQPDGITLIAKYVDKKLVFNEQAIKVSDGNVVLSGLFSAGGQNYYSYGTPNSSVPDMLFNGYMLEKGTVVVEPGENTSYGFRFFAMGLLKCDSSMSPVGQLGSSITFADMQNAGGFDKEYEKWLGKWAFKTTSSKGVVTDHILTLYEYEAGKSFIAEFDDENGYYGGMAIPVLFQAGKAVFNGLQLSDEPMETDYGKANAGFTAFITYKGAATPWGLESHVIGMASLAEDGKSWTMPAGKLNGYDVCGMGFGAVIIEGQYKDGFLSMGDMIDIPLTMTRVESTPAAKSVDVSGFRKDFSNISLSTSYGFYKNIAVRAAGGIASIKIAPSDDNTVIKKFSPKENNKKALKPCRKADKKVARQK